WRRRGETRRVALGAFALAVGLFCFWGLLGHALVSLLHTRRNSLLNLLLAPSAGLCLTVLGVFVCNRAGIPVAHAARLLTAGLAGAACLLLLVLRPAVPVRAATPLAGVLLLGLFLAGRPILQFGYDWVSTCNDDMVNYCLGAQRFLHHGFFGLPAEQDLLE